MILRSLFFCVLLTVAALAPVIVFAISALFYALFYSAYELIFLALAIDVFYGSGYPVHIPYYTIVALISVFFIEWVKPYISVYNQ